MKTLILFVIVVLALNGLSTSSEAFSQSYQLPKTLTLAQQQEDFKIFRGALEEIHIGLNWFIAKKELDDLFDETYRSLAENAAVEDYYLKLRLITASLRHGHSGIALPQEDGVNYRLALLSKSKKFFPLAIRILDDRVFVAVNTSANDRLAAGTEVLSINGEPVKKILDKQLPLMFANGRNASFKYARLENYYEFHYLYQLMNRGVERFVIEAVPYGSQKKQKFELQGESPATISERFEKITGKNISSYENVLQYRVLDEKNKIAYLKLGSFYSGVAQNYAQFLDKTFADIKQKAIAYLIVDVRGNEGGGDGFWQMAYVYTTSNALAGGADVSLYLAGDKFSYLKYIENPSPDFKLFAENPFAVIEKAPNNRFRLKPQFSEEDRKSYAAPPNAYSGKLYVLQNGLTFSAATAYLETVNRELRKQNRSVEFIGDEAGEDFESGVTSGGASASLRLPNSKIIVTIPLLGGGDAAPYSIKPNSLIPNHRVIPTARNLAEKSDAELDFALALIKRQRLPKN